MTNIMEELAIAIVNAKETAKIQLNQKGSLQKMMEDHLEKEKEEPSGWVQRDGYKVRIR